MNKWQKEQIERVCGALQKAKHESKEDFKMLFEEMEIQFRQSMEDKLKGEEGSELSKFALFTSLTKKLDARSKQSQELSDALINEKKESEREVKRLEILIERAKKDLANLESSFLESKIKIAESTAENIKKIEEDVVNASKEFDEKFANDEKELNMVIETNSTKEKLERKKQKKRQVELEEEIKPHVETFEQKEQELKDLQELVRREEKEFEELTTKFSKIDEDERIRLEEIEKERQRMDVYHWPPRQIQKYYRGWKARQAFAEMKKKQKKGKKKKGKKK